jgi:hypothetical protein
VNLWRAPYSLSHRRFSLIFSLFFVFSTIF